MCVCVCCTLVAEMARRGASVLSERGRGAYKCWTRCDFFGCNRVTKARRNMTGQSNWVPRLENQNCLEALTRRTAMERTRVSLTAVRNGEREDM